jgi:hypothetical protein
MYFDRQLDDGQVAQAEEVELHQPDLFDVVLVELRTTERRAVGALNRAGRSR